MRIAKFVRTLAFGVTALAIGTAYADSINGPGTPPLSVTFHFNLDSRVISATTGAHGVSLSNGTGTANISGSIDADGHIDSSGPIFFDAIDSGGWKAQLQASPGGGTFCPNSGIATYALYNAEVVVMKYNNITLLSPCYIHLGTINLTTESSGQYTGVRFTKPNPIMVGKAYSFPDPTGPLIGGPPVYCPGQLTQSGAWLAIKNFYKTGPSATGSVQLSGASISPAVYGDGC